MTAESMQQSERATLIKTLEALNIRPVSVGINTQKCHDFLGKIENNRITFKKSHVPQKYGKRQNTQKVRTIQLLKVRTIQPKSRNSIIHIFMAHGFFFTKIKKITTLLKNSLLINTKFLYQRDYR